MSLADSDWRRVMAAQPKYLCYHAEVPTGLYRHYKGSLYLVLFFARHSETEEGLVVYKQLDDDRIWVRPSEMFRENVVVDGRQCPRFEYVRSDADLKDAASPNLR
jgi:hypothetical protein